MNASMETTALEAIDVEVVEARGLLAADKGGTSDPFAEVLLVDPALHVLPGDGNTGRTLRVSQSCTAPSLSVPKRNQRRSSESLNPTVSVFASSMHATHKPRKDACQAAEQREI